MQLVCRYAPGLPKFVPRVSPHDILIQEALAINGAEYSAEIALLAAEFNDTWTTVGLCTLNQVDP